MSRWLLGSASFVFCGCRCQSQPCHHAASWETLKQFNLLIRQYIKPLKHIFFLNRWIYHETFHSSRALHVVEDQECLAVVTEQCLFSFWYFTALQSVSIDPEEVCLCSFQNLLANFSARSGHSGGKDRILDQFRHIRLGLDEETLPENILHHAEPRVPVRISQRWW